MMAATPASSKRLAMSSAESSEVSRPALDRDLAVARVEADGDAAGKCFRRFLHQRRIAHRRRADDDAGDALAEPALDGGAVADAAAELHRDFHRGEDALDRRGIHRLAGESAVEIDDVEILEALRRESARLLGRVAMEHRRARHVALFEAHGFAVFQIDGGKKDHGFHFRKFAISARPSFWLFSGWNCVPTMLSRADDRGDRAAIVGLGHEIGALRHLELIGVHEIGVQALRPERQAVDQLVRPRDIERVPAHVRNFQLRIARRDAIDFAGDPAQPLGDFVFAAALGQKLHADADAEERPALAMHRFLERRDHAVDGVEAAPAIGEGADAGQHHAIGGRHHAGSLVTTIG